MTLDRQQIPSLITPETIRVIRAEATTLDNGLRVYVINAGSEDVVRLDLIFPSQAAGRTGFNISSATHQLIDSGTSENKAIDIAEALDYYGAHLQTDFGPDWKSISLYSLSRFFPDTLSTLMEILQDPIYPDDEIDNWKTRHIQAIKVNREKVSWLAKTEFTKTLFGNDHPYGITMLEKDIESISAPGLRTFFKSGYHWENATVIISGKAGPLVIKTLNDHLGLQKINGESGQKNDTAGIQVLPPVKQMVEKKEAVQSGVRIGKILFSKYHPDFPAMQIVNTLLGGYFGSRLMSNIREDKGYTYGIGSGIHPHLKSGYFFIATEVGTEVREAAVGEIYKELKRLTVEPVPPAELLLVKNYLIGSFQRSLDGPFALADRFRGLHLFGLDYDYLDAYLRLLHSITPEKVMELAHLHFQPESMTEIIAG